MRAQGRSQPQGQSRCDKSPSSLSSLLLIYRWGFLLAEPTRKWEGEEARSCNRTGNPGAHSR